MNCPRCTAEVEEGAEECPNCGAELGADSPDAYETPAGDADTELAEGALVQLYSTEDEMDCAGTCKQLRKAGIPFKVSQHREQSGKRLDEHYKIGVPPEFLKDAKEVLGLNEPGEIDPSVELPAEEVPEEGIDAGEEDDYDKGKDRNEAKLEIWSGNADDVGMIEMCLKENGIRAYVENGEKGKAKIKVASEHEMKAKEIVKELADEKPE